MPGTAVGFPSTHAKHFFTITRDSCATDVVLSTVPWRITSFMHHGQVRWCQAHHFMPEPTA